MRRSIGRGRGSAGSATLMVAAAMSMTAVVGLVVAEATVVMVQSARADTAADAVALATIDGGRQRALAVAARYGAEVDRLEISGRTATVRVSVGRATAVARASAEP